MIRFGRTNVRVPAVSLGTWGHGGELVTETGQSVGWSGHDDTQAKQALVAAWRNGITHWDTADVYGDGRAERLIGEVFEATVPRKDIFLATKFGWDMGPTHFTLRIRNGTVQLIGFDRLTIMRNTGKTEELSINFLTARVKEAYGRAENDNPDVVRWHRLKSKRVPTIDAIEGWESFDPEGWTKRVFG